MSLLIPSEIIFSKVHLIRNRRVMLDFDLAKLYGVETRTLNQSVQRNISRFPEDFMFQISEEEFQMMSQFVISSQRTRKKSSLPYAFTEQGIAMLSSVLRSERAVQVNIAIMRSFVQMREAMLTHKELTQKLEEMEKKYDSQFKLVFDALRSLVDKPTPPKRPIGFFEEKKPFEATKRNIARK